MSAVRVTIGGQQFELSKRAGNEWVARCVESGESTRLTLADVNALLGIENAPAPVLDLSGVAVATEGPVAAAIARIRSCYDHDHLAVLLDTSTVRNAMAAITDGLPGPLQLLDLSILVQAVACHDVVLVQRGQVDPFADVNGVPPVFVPLCFTREEVADTLWSLCNEANTRKALEPDLAREWQAFLGLGAVPRIDLTEFSSYQDSPGDWDGVPATTYSDFVQTGVLEDEDELSRFLSIQTFRTFFNDRLANLLNEPYWASSFRAPVTCRLLREKALTREMLDKVFSAMGVGANQGAHDGPYMRRLSLPPLTAILLQELEHIGEFWLALEDLRARMTPFRDAVRRDRSESDGKGSLLLERYADCLAQASGELGSQGATTTAQDVTELGIGAAIATVALPPPAASAIAKVFAALGGGVLAKAYERLVRPDVQVVGNIAAEARVLVGLDRQLARLWKKEWNRDRYEQLESLAAAQPHGFLGLPSGN